MQIRIDCIGLACHQCVISNAISKMMVGKTIGHIENIFPVCFFICLFKFRVSDFFPKFIFVNCTRLTCLLSFASLFKVLVKVENVTLSFLSTVPFLNMNPQIRCTNGCILTKAAFVLLFSSMYFQMTPEIAWA